MLTVSLLHPALCFKNLSSVAALRDDAQLLCIINNFEMFLDFTAHVPTAESLINIIHYLLSSSDVHKM